MIYEPNFDKNSLKAVELAQQAEAAKLARQREQAAQVQAGYAESAAQYAAQVAAAGGADAIR